MIKKNRAISEKVGAWTKEDEITILKGLIKLKTEKGKIRLDYVQLYESIKHFLGHKSATPLHLQKKVKYLGEKYKNTLKSTRTLTIPHEEEFFYQDLVLTTISRNQSNPLQIALQQYKLVSQSLSTRKSYANQIFRPWVTQKRRNFLN
uniref:Putative ovule protein n=1 Tax=Solanum chacoense TaxID=4108 RepID=A0A0V0I3R9_SOLCH